MLVVGDTGKASLFMVNDKNQKWTEIKKWNIHNIMTYDNNYVCTVKASHSNNLFITATIQGNVKIWSIDGDYLADLNQQSWPGDLTQIANSYFDQSPIKGGAKNIVSFDLADKIIYSDSQNEESSESFSLSPTKI